MSDRISIPVDGWKLEARKFDGGIEIAIVTDDKPPASHYVRLSAIGSAALRDYLFTAIRSQQPARRKIVTEEGCMTCAEIARGSFGPSHDPSPRCESGKRPHCTCDICF